MRSGGLAGRQPLRLEVDQRKAARRVGHTSQMHRRFHEHELQRRTHMCLEQMTTVRGAIVFADDNVRVHLRFAVGDRYVASEREHFDLLAYRYALVTFSIPVEVTEHHVTECSDPREVAAPEMQLVGESREGRHRLVSSLEDQSKGPLAVVVNQLRFHWCCAMSITSARWSARRPVV